ncbi:MAG TPA: shikimate kinase [Dissulfurispiraceae bacterium]|nr:shikimate kinase [Dissulfurispiraceae bacterium]
MHCSRRNIVLIGMPGAGKSTVGVLLAKALGMPFVDTDLLIQASEGRLLQDIIDSGGIGEFLRVEEKVILSLNVRGHVIATGGSVVYSTGAMEHLRRDGFIIYLDVPLEQVEERIRNITTRGIAMRKGQDLREVYEERAPLYRKYADITVDCSGKDMETVVRIIADEYGRCR